MQRWDIIFILSSTILALVVFTVLAVVISLFYESFISDFIKTGTVRFFLNNREGKSDVKDLLSSFSSGHYLKNAWIFFYRHLQILLWTLCFIIPGIVKSLEMSMVPYILAEQPDLSKEEVFHLSKELTDGNKARILLLGLSFILWEILCTITGGIVRVFWVGPYIEAMYVELYKGLLKEYNQNNNYGVEYEA